MHLLSVREERRRERRVWSSLKAKCKAQDTKLDKSRDCYSAHFGALLLSSSRKQKEIYCRVPAEQSDIWVAVIDDSPQHGVDEGQDRQEVQGSVDRVPGGVALELSVNTS